LKKLFLISIIIYSYGFSDTKSELNENTFLIEDFSKSKIGRFPSDWKSKKSIGEKLYIVSKDKNNKFLSVTDRGESVQIGKPISWDIKKFPVLKWRWRVKELPVGANESNDETNDSAAGLYVVFDNAWLFIPRTIKYVWSSSLPKGTVIEKGYTRIVVIRSGKDKINSWSNESVNIYNDYEKFFGKTPPNPRGIALLTDANATRSIAVADYAHFKAYGETQRELAGEEN
jgi:hypothetical protein